MTQLNTPEPIELEEGSSFSWWVPLLIFALIWWGIPWIIPQLPVWLVGEKAAWFLSRSSGVVGYLTIVASTLWGLLLSTKLIKEFVPPAVSLALHEWLSWTGIGLSVFHAFVLLYDSYYTYSVAHLLIPFIGPYNPMWVGVGIIALYMMLITSVTFYMRGMIGQKNWRKIHYLTFVAFIFATAHGWMAGTDSLQLAWMYGISGFSVIFLTIYRIIAAVTNPKKKRVKAS